MRGRCCTYSWPIARLHLVSVCITNDHGYVPFVVIIIRSFSHSWFITGV